MGLPFTSRGRAGIPGPVRTWAIAAGIGILLGLLLGLRFGAVTGVAVGLGVTAFLGWFLGRRDRRRAEIAEGPFPPEWRAILEEWVEYYRELRGAEKERFEREVGWFVDEHVITGPRGAEVEDELRVLVAASAVVIVFGRRGFRYPQMRDIVIYERAFAEDYEVGGNILGMVHGQGPIIFSAQSLRQGFRGEHDGHNVGYHEFAHVLDFDQGRTDGVPGFMPWSSVRPWLQVMHDETTKIERRRSLLRRYAATNEAEFFAVATEMFFEKPKRMKDKHPDLYELLVETYGQDPARGRGSITRSHS